MIDYKDGAKEDEESNLACCFMAGLCFYGAMFCLGFLCYLLGV